MTNTNNLPIYHQLYMFTKLLYKTVHNMTREYKYTLGQDMINLSWRCVDLALSANILPNSEKFGEIAKLSIAFDKLKLRLRMAQEVEIISVKEYVHWQDDFIQPIGEQLGGWQKWAKNVPKGDHG